MIINIRGTGGSGKSTIVREVMKRYTSVSPHHIAGRRQPLLYICSGSRSAKIADPRPLAVLGHYETACGGCDTITNVETVFNLVSEYAKAGYDVLFEGIISQDDVRRTAEINRELPIHVIILNTPIQVCLDSIQARRDERGDTRPLSKKNTLSRADRVKKIAARLKDAGVQITSASREETLNLALEAFGWKRSESSSLTQVGSSETTSQAQPEEPPKTTV
jgi:hypothetical protein